MRLILCTVSALALSGCSWLGNITGGSKHDSYKASQYGAYQSTQQANALSRCQISAPNQPIPRGCNPADVTFGTGYNSKSYYQGATNSFPQQPQFGQPSYATGNYGSHVSQAAQHRANYQSSVPQLRKPKFRGSLSLGAEKSFSGDVYSPANASISAITNYDPTTFNEGNIDGSVASERITQTVYTAGARDRGTAPYDELRQPNLSFDDVWSTPVSVAIGGEYILSQRNTIFANAGYTASSGKSVGVGTVEATLYQDVTTQDYDDTGAPVGGPITNVSFVPNEEIARFEAQFSDMERIDLEVGGRHYFNSWNKSGGLNTVTPFIGMAVGASHYNAVSYELDQSQRYYQRAIDNPDDEATQFYDVDGNEASVVLYDSQWVPNAQLNAGVEWQVTPRTGIALETGLRFEGPRKYSNGVDGDRNISFPLKIRGSYNF